jgi:hypothetical protein
MPWLIAFLVLAFMVLWAILPPVAVALILIVGGVWLLVLGLCTVASRADDLALRHYEETIENVVPIRRPIGETWTDEDRSRFEKQDNSDSTRRSR